MHVITAWATSRSETPSTMVFDVQERIRQFSSYLDPSNSLYQPEPQHINIRAAIKLYEGG